MSPSKPRVWNKHHKNAPPDAVYVGRPSKWGNPFKIGDVVKVGRNHPLYPIETQSSSGGHQQYITIKRGEAVKLYEWWIKYGAGVDLKLPFEELRGKDLVCWCAPKPCHADILLELANPHEPGDARSAPGVDEFGGSDF